LAVDTRRRGGGGGDGCGKGEKVVSVGDGSQKTAAKKLLAQMAAATKKKLLSGGLIGKALGGFGKGGEADRPFCR
jgi:hypothetical protein